MRLLFIFVLSFFISNSYSQVKNKVLYTQSAEVTTLLNRFIDENQNKQTTQGYRVQLHFGNDRDKAREIKSKFLNSYQTIAAYESYQQPNFRIRVGDFRTRLEALKFLKEVKVEFPSAFVVTDEIKFPAFPK